MNKKVNKNNNNNNKKRSNRKQQTWLEAHCYWSFKNGH